MARWIEAISLIVRCGMRVNSQPTGAHDMTSPFTVRLEGLRCVSAQESDGDEIYLLVDGKQVWSVGTRRMTSEPSDGEQISEVDFLQGRWKSMHGWESMPNFIADEFVILVQGEGARVE